MQISRTPYRISLFGGGSDHPRWFRYNRGRVLSFAINKYSYLMGREIPAIFMHKYRLAYSRFETPSNIEEILHPAFREGIRHFGKELRLELQHQGDLPPRSGVGSSSSFAVGLINILEKLNGNTLTKEELAKKAIYLEQEVLGENVGCQDQIAVSHGGINAIEFSDRGWKLSPLYLSPKMQNELEEGSFLVFTGVQRSSSDVTKSLFEDFSSKEPMLRRLVQIADEASELFCNANSLDFLGDLLNESWALKKQTNKATSSGVLDELIDYGFACGAKGAKVLGAGGGGFVLFWLANNERESFKSKFHKGVHVPFKLDYFGSQLL